MNSKFTTIVRIVLGILLIVFGSNKFLHFIPISVTGASAQSFLKSLETVGYLFPVLGAFEMITGLMLLLKKWSAFAIILLTPITINILLFHLFLDIPGLGIAFLIATLNGILIYKNRKKYSPLFI